MKGELRLGTWVEILGHGSFKWRHWGCGCHDLLTAQILIARYYRKGDQELARNYGAGGEH